MWTAAKCHCVLVYRNLWSVKEAENVLYFAISFYGKINMDFSAIFSCTWKCVWARVCVREREMRAYVMHNIKFSKIIKAIRWFVIHYAVICSLSMYFGVTSSYFGLIWFFLFACLLRRFFHIGLDFCSFSSNAFCSHRIKNKVPVLVVVFSLCVPFCIHFSLFFYFISSTFIFIFSSLHV